MSNTKKSLMNLSIDSELFESLKKQSEAKDVKLSAFVGDWLAKLGLEKPEIKRVILQIPPAAFESRAALESWLIHRCREVVSHYSKEL
jgi:hypothetical protein